MNGETDVDTGLMIGDEQITKGKGNQENSSSLGK